MSARHVLLGLLLDRPAYPYQMADRLEQRLGPSWRVDSGQLYKTVKVLERGGLIERVDDTAENPPPDNRAERHVFAITQRGIEEFERWFEETRDPVRLPRRPLLAKITFAGPDRLARTMTKLEDYERGCAERLSETTGMRDALPSIADERLRADHLLLRLSLSSDIYALEGELHWAKEANELLTWLSEHDRALWPNGSAADGRKVAAIVGAGEVGLAADAQRVGAGAGLGLHRADLRGFRAGAGVGVGFIALRDTGEIGLQARGHRQRQPCEFLV